MSVTALVLPFLMFSVRGREPRNPRLSVRQGPGPTELFIFIIESEREREREESSTNQGANWNRNHRLCGLVSLIFSQITGARLDSAVLAPLSVLQSVHQSPPDPPGHWRRPLALRLRAASRDQWEAGTGVGTDWSLMWGRGDTTDSARVVGSLSREIITRYNIISWSHSQLWVQEQTSNPSLVLSLFHCEEGQLAGEQILWEEF